MTMQSTATLFGEKKIEKPKKGGPRSPRDEILDYFYKVLNSNRGTFPPVLYGRIVKRLQGLQLADLRYMHSYMKDLARDKGTEAAAKWFWWATDPRNISTKNYPSGQSVCDRRCSAIYFGRLSKRIIRFAAAVAAARKVCQPTDSPWPQPAPRVPQTER
jgi:hypothetical protein